MTKDDTVRQGKQAREDTLLAMLEAGLLEGQEHYGLENQADIEAMYSLMAEKKADLYIYKVPRDIAERGRVAGIVAAATISGIPEAARGKVIITFDGWADDPRELMDIPIVREFCEGLVFLDPDEPSWDNAKRVIRVLMNEAEGAIVGGVLVDPYRLNQPGGIWLVSLLYSNLVYIPSPTAPAGYLRDIGKAIALREWIVNGPCMEFAESS